MVNNKSFIKRNIWIKKKSAFTGEAGFLNDIAQKHNWQNLLGRSQ